MLELPWMDNFERSKKPKRLPVVLTTLEIQMFLREVAVAPEPIGLIIKLLYGTGMRLMEAVRLRVKDIELIAKRLWCVMAKVERICMTMLPGSLLEAMHHQLAQQRKWYDKDILVDKVDMSGCRMRWLSSILVYHWEWGAICIFCQEIFY